METQHKVGILPPVPRSTPEISMRFMTVAALAAMTLTGCASGSWMGAAKEKSYDDDLKAKNASAGLNNDDYYEIHQEGKILVFSDAKDFKTWLKVDEMPLLVTKIGEGPSGETMKYSLTKNETKAMEKSVGYRGASQNMFDGAMVGTTSGFFGLVNKKDTYFVFDNWNVYAGYRNNGRAEGYSENLGPKGEKVVFVGASSKPEATATKFMALFDGK